MIKHDYVVTNLLIQRKKEVIRQFGVPEKAIEDAFRVRPLSTFETVRSLDCFGDNIIREYLNDVNDACENMTDIIEKYL